jgi:hypothetical protein
MLLQHSQVLRLPILRPKAAKKLLGEGLAPRAVPILGSGSAPTTEDTLQQFLQHAGALFGKDPTKWDKIGESEQTVVRCWRHSSPSPTHVCAC